MLITLIDSLQSKGTANKQDRVTGLEGQGQWTGREAIHMGSVFCSGRGKGSSCENWVTM